MKKNTKKNIPEFYKRKLNGYRCSHRNRWLLIFDGKLSLQSLSLFEFYIDISDFDPKHLAYGTFKIDFSKISSIFLCSPNTVRNWHNQLKKHGLIQSTDERGVYKITFPERYNSPGRWQGESGSYAKAEKNQSIGTIFQLMRTGIQHVENKIQPLEQNNPIVPENKDSIALGYSKYSSKVNNSNDELSEEDKEWIKLMS
jgi:hypothetical protein